MIGEELDTSPYVYNFRDGTEILGIYIYIAPTNLFVENLIKLGVYFIKTLSCPGFFIMTLSIYMSLIKFEYRSIFIVGYCITFNRFLNVKVN